MKDAVCGIKTAERETDAHTIAGTILILSELATKANTMVNDKLYNYSCPREESPASSSKPYRSVGSPYFSEINDKLMTIDRMLEDIIRIVSNCEL